MTDVVLIDTDVASFLFKKAPRADAFRALLGDRSLALAFVSVAELFKWTVKRKWSPAKVAQLEAALRRFVVIPYDRDLAWMWARTTAQCEDAGRPISSSDAWIAAVALRYDLPLATNNLKHFEPIEALCGLKLLRPSS